MSFNFKEFKRFEKQIILKKIGIQGQKKIKKAKVSGQIVLNLADSLFFLLEILYAVALPRGDDICT